MQVGRGMTGRSIAIMHISNVSTEELLEKRRSFILSKEVRQHRLLKIDIVLRQDQKSECNIAITWAPEGKRRRGRPKTT